MRWIAVLCVIAVGVGIFATATIPAATVTPDQAILKFFPPDTQGVAFVDVAGLRNSPLAQDVMAGKITGLPRGTRDFEALTGFSIQRDLDRVTLARIGSRQVLAVVEGQFDRVKIEAFLKDKGAESETYLGRGLFRHDTFGVAFVDNIILAGYYEAVKKAIDQVSLPGSVPLRSDLMDAITRIETGNQVWAVGDVPVDQLPATARGPVLELLRSLQGATYQMRVDRDIHAIAIANFVDSNSARSVTDLARGAIAVAKLQVAQLPDSPFLQALDGVQISNSGSSVEVTVEESGSLLKKLQEYRTTLPRAQ